MSTKLYFILLGTLLLVHCVLSKAVEETGKDNSNDHSEEQITKNQLMQHVAKSYIKMVDETAASMRKSFESVINDVETNKVTFNTNVEEKLLELKTTLEKADTKATTTTTEKDEARNKYPVRKDLLKFFRDLYKIKDENENTTPTEQELNFLRTVDTALEEFVKNVETFVESTIPELENYWKGLSTTEQNEMRNLHRVIFLLKVASCPRQQLDILEKLFEFRDDFTTNVITW